jgi:hypothetical protein
MTPATARALTRGHRFATGGQRRPGRRGTAAVYDAKPGKRGRWSLWWSRFVGAVGRTVARRHPALLPDVSRAGPATRRDRSTDLRQLLLEPEMLRAIELDLHPSHCWSSSMLPDTTRATARQVVSRRRTSGAATGPRTKQAVHGALARANAAAGCGSATLGSHHPCQPSALPARATHSRTRAPDRLRPTPTKPSRDVIVAIDQSAHGRQRRGAPSSARLASMPPCASM